MPLPKGACLITRSVYLHSELKCTIFFVADATSTGGYSYISLGQVSCVGSLVSGFIIHFF